ncbi:MAG: Gfo/Idh/MocA family oxidoreductase, partial [Actinomycetota bacterium]|nr:Gfo/Idh/MocA family oxidoreductase [Actinomycetota bacterium]
ELFEDDRVEIVVSATPPDVRPDHVVAAAETGRHVVIEKPVALSMAAVDRIRTAVSKAGVKTVTSFVLRWNPQFVTLRKLIDDGLLGDLMYAEADYWNPSDPSARMTWRETAERGGGAFVEGGCHAVDAMRYLGGEIAEVAAFSSPARRDRKYEFDPVVVASVRLEHGAVGKLSAIVDGDAPYGFNVRLFGNSGTVQNNRVFSSERYPGVHDYWEFPTISPDRDDVTHHPFAAEIAHFMDCIANDVESHASIHDSYRTMAAVFAIEASLAAGGQPVRVEDVMTPETR